MDERETAAAMCLRFGEFELRRDSDELLRCGAPVKLQAQPARVLGLIARGAGELVSREEIRRTVWGDETYVDLDLSLNFCIRQIRLALGDSAEEPHFIATIPRRGYRFLAPVEIVRPPEAAPTSRPARALRQAALVAILAALVLLAGLIGLRAGRARAAAPRPGDAEPRSPEAVRVWRAGEHFHDSGRHPQAREAFATTTVLAPGFAPGFAGLARELLESELPARQVLPEMTATESRALALDPSLPLAHLDRANRLFLYVYDWRGAEAEFRLAIGLDPQAGETHYRYALFLAARGRFDAALAEVDRAQAIDPASLLVGSDHAWFLYLARHYDAAVEQAKRTLDLAAGGTIPANPRDYQGFLTAYQVILLAEERLGDRDSALAAAQQRARWLQAPRPADLRSYWTYRKLYTSESSAPWVRAWPAIELGEVERAIDLLLEGCRERAGMMTPFLRVDPLYDPLRSNPRFGELLRCANLADKA